MDQANLVDDLAAWVEASHPTDGTRRNLHCSRIWKAVPGPSLGGVSVVSVRHQVPLVSRAPDLFVVELWDLRPGEIGDSDAARMCAQLAAYRAWYDEILEEAEIQGRGRRHRFSVHGNLVGASIGASPLIDVLSLHGREVAFWTCRRSEDGTDFLPHSGKNDRLLPHLYPQCSTTCPGVLRLSRSRPRTTPSRTSAPNLRRAESRRRSD